MSRDTLVDPLHHCDTVHPPQESHELFEWPLSLKSGHNNHVVRKQGSLMEQFTSNLELLLLQGKENEIATFLE
jgi:hypothetical protein